jgi:hypothetical protein
LRIEAIGVRVLYLVPPGRIPTVIIDPGLWWDTVAGSGQHEIFAYSANYHWWRALCRPAVKRALLSSLRPAQKLRRRLEWRVADLDLSATADAASRALDALETYAAYRSASGFIDAAKALADHLDALNAAQPEIKFSVTPGFRVQGLNYDDSRALVAYARADGMLDEWMRSALSRCPRNVDFLAVSVTSAESLLAAMVAVRLLRAQNPRMHVCLADHGYENFSLHAHMEKLRESRSLEQVFDTIVETKDARDTVLPQIIAAVAAGTPPRGYIAGSEVPPLPEPPPRGYSPPPPLPTFTPEPVLFTRLSRRRCYWNRCTFCTQNTKYDDPKAPSRLEIPHSLNRLASYVKAGYRNIVYSDEAISPGTLKALCEEIETQKLDFRWTCRCRLELSHTRELFERMRNAGCYEVLFGLESISPRVQKLMDKHLGGMDEPRVKRVFEDMEAAGLAVHVTMIAGFPGDSLEDSERTVDFVIDALRQNSSATFYLNRFALYPDTIILREPARFGISEVHARGDMPSGYGFTFDAEIRDKTQPVLDRYSELDERLAEGLGWRCLGNGSSAKIARLLYFTSGCGAIFKTQMPNPFARPLLDQVPRNQVNLAARKRSRPADLQDIRGQDQGLSPE